MTFDWNPMVGRPPTQTPARRPVVLFWTAVGALLAVHAGLLLTMARGDSAAWDEVGHFAAGVHHWYTGQFNMYAVNPPLVRLIDCAPIALKYPGLDVGLAGSSPEPSARPEFQAGIRLAQSLGPQYFSLLSVARIGTVALSVLGGLLCGAWARDLYGSAAGVLAVALWAFEPNLMGHGHLITPDTGAAALGVAAGYTFWRWLARPGWTRAVVAGTALGLAELTKTTWVVLLPLWVVLWAWWAWTVRKDRTARPGPTTAVVQLGAILLIAIWSINLGYGFEGSFKALGEIRGISRMLAGDRSSGTGGPVAVNRFSGTALGALPVPLPENYVLGIDVQKADFERKLWSYLRGEWRRGGWWYYYLYALAIKVPLGTWAMLLLAAGLTAWWPARYAAAGWRGEIVLLAPALVILVLVSSQTGINHHLRYVLPCFPFAIVWASKVARSIDLRHRAVTVAGGLALAWSAYSSLSVFPHSMSYFNELVGGPERGHYHLGSSNVDWGQDLLYLKRWLDEHPEATDVAVGYDLGPLINPSLAGIAWRPLPAGPGRPGLPNDGRRPMEVGPLPGWHAVSACLLHASGHEYDYFAHLTPVARIGYSTYVYHVSTADADRVRAILGLPPTGGPVVASPSSPPLPGTGPTAIQP